MPNTYRIEELANLVARALDKATIGQNSARIREVPDVRTIRYYTTLGLLDRPLEMQGRTALYGRRHLLQLLAVKKLQADGHTLTDIQRTLAGADDPTLRGILDLSQRHLDELETSLQTDTAKEEAPQTIRSPRRKSRAFWAQQPRVTPTVATTTQEETISQAAVLHLAPGISLMLDGADAGQIDNQTISRLRPAITDLLQALQSVGLKTPPIHPSTEAER